jgi:hypothetical protein
MMHKATVAQWQSAALVMLRSRVQSSTVAFAFGGCESNATHTSTCYVGETVRVRVRVRVSRAGSPSTNMPSATYASGLPGKPHASAKPAPGGRLGGGGGATVVVGAAVVGAAVGATLGDTLGENVGERVEGEAVGDTEGETFWERE